MIELTDDQVKALLDGATPGPWRADGEPWNRVVWSPNGNRVCFMAHSSGLDDARDIATSNLAAAAPDLARALLDARADAEAAVALALEEADLAVQAVSDNCETDGERLAIMAAVSAIRALAPTSGIAKLAELLAERDEWRAVSETLSEMQAGEYKRAEQLAAELAQVRADAKAAVAVAITDAAGKLQDWEVRLSAVGKRDAAYYVDLSAALVRAIASEDAIAEVAKLRAERDMWTETARLHLNAEQAFLSWLREAGEHMRAEGVTVCDDGVDSGDILAAKVAECAALLKADRDRLAAELAAANAREAGLRALLINRDGGSHDEDCKARRYANSDGLCNCGHDGVVAALAQPSTEGEA